MPNRPSPQNLDEFSHLLGSSLAEEHGDPGAMTDAEVTSALAERGLDPFPAIQKVRHLLDGLRRERLGIGELEQSGDDLIQHCRRTLGGIAMPVYEEIMVILGSLAPGQIDQACAYASTVNPHDVQSVDQFQDELKKLRDGAPPDEPTS